MALKLKRRELKKVGITLPNSPRTPKQKNDPRLFVELCIANDLPAPVPEYRFHPSREWRFDWVFSRAPGVALEIEGIRGNGIGCHQRIGRFLSDMEKYNEAAILGWCVLRVTWKQINSGEAFALVKRALGIE